MDDRFLKDSPYLILSFLCLPHTFADERSSLSFLGAREGAISRVIEEELIFIAENCVLSFCSTSVARRDGLFSPTVFSPAPAFCKSSFFTLQASRPGIREGC